MFAQEVKYIEWRFELTKRMLATNRFLKCVDLSMPDLFKWKRWNDDGMENQNMRRQWKLCLVFANKICKFESSSLHFFLFTIEIRLFQSMLWQQPLYEFIYFLLKLPTKSNIDCLSSIYFKCIFINGYIMICNALNINIVRHFIERIYVCTVPLIHQFANTHDVWYWLHRP